MRLFRRLSRRRPASDVAASWAEVCFERTRPHVEIDGEASNGCVAVLLPRTGIPLLDRLVKRLGASDHRLRLDDIGTFVWRRLDGRRPVEQIGRELIEQFGSRVQPVEQTLVTFLQSLLRAGAIRRCPAANAP